MSRARRADGTMRARVSTLLLAWLVLACGKTVPAGGVAKNPSAPPATSAQAKSEPITFEHASDLIPADLDLVLRFDLARIRQGLGDDSASELSEQALDKADVSGLMREALSRADTVWLGVRVSDLDVGDRVMAVHYRRPAGDASAPGSLEPDTIAWERLPTAQPKLSLFAARDKPSRTGTALIALMGSDQAAFASPVEAQSLRRLLRTGPDPERGQPTAEGLVSIDYRARRLTPRLENRFPSLAALIAGIDRIRAIVSLSGAKFELSGRIHCKSTGAAVKVEQFLATIGAASKARPELEELLGALKLERNDRTLIVRWPMPTSLVLQALEN